MAETDDTDDFDIDSSYFAIVIDNGSGSMKAGVAGDSDPRINIQSVTTKSIDDNNNIEIIYPIKNGIIQNEEAVEKLWYKIIYDELKLKPDKIPILLTEPSLNPKSNREKMIEIIFETFNASATYIGMKLNKNYTNFW